MAAVVLEVTQGKMVLCIDGGMKIRKDLFGGGDTGVFKYLFGFGTTPSWKLGGLPGLPPLRQRGPPRGPPKNQKKFLLSAPCRKVEKNFLRRVARNGDNFFSMQMTKKGAFTCFFMQL